MNLRARAFIGLSTLLGIGSFALTAVFTGGEGVGPLVAFATFVVLIGVNWAFPLLLVSEDETEAVNLDEAFLVAMLLVLPPLGILAAYAGGTAVGSVIRRRSPMKTVFNISQQVTAGACAAAVSHGLIGVDGPLGPRHILAAAAGAATYFVLNSSAVSLVISLVEGRAFGSVWLEGGRLRLMASIGGGSLGLLAGIAVTAYDWALLFAAIPLCMLFVVSASHVRAKRDRERMLGLFKMAADAHASMQRGDVELAVAESAKKFLRCRTARFTATPPRDGELGAKVADDRWLVVGDRWAGQSFDEEDQALLDAVVAVAVPALDNAALFEQVAVERRKMTDVVTSSSDGIFSVDGEQRIQSWNPAMEHITGFAASDVVGSKCFTVFRPRDESGQELCVAACPGRCGHRDAVPVQVTTITGDQRWLTCTYAPMPDDGYVVVARDITAQKQVDDLKADFLATVSHELRTPLTPIQGFLHTLMRDDVAFDDVQRQRFYEVMLRQSERLERLVKDLLDATTLQDPDQLFLPEEVDWTQAVQHVVEAFRGQDGTRELVVDIEPGVPHVVADEQRAEQVLSNLLSNALKYSDGGPIHIRVEARGERVVTTVVDRGPGVPAADRDRIFERFTRLGDHMTRKVGGAGLGLFIAKRLVEGMGGEISVTNAPDGGAAFTFTLPQYERTRTRS